MLGGDTRLGVVGGGSGSCPTFEVADGGPAGDPACSVGRCGRHQRSIETGTVQRWGVPVMPGDSTEKAPLGLPARGAGRGDLRRVDARGGRWWQLGIQRGVRAGAAGTREAYRRGPSREGGPRHAGGREGAIGVAISGCRSW